jgi:hypothetical protein
MKMKDDPQQIIKAYFDGLAAKDVSGVPWADNATLRTPLNPAGGESALICGRKAIFDFFTSILPALRSVKVIRHYAGEAGWRSSNGSLPPKSNSVLHHGSALRHETTLSNSNTPRASARYAPLRSVGKQIPSCSLINDSFHNTVSP